MKASQVMVSHKRAFLGDLGAATKVGRRLMCGTNGVERPKDSSRSRVFNDIYGFRNMLCYCIRKVRTHVDTARELQRLALYLNRNMNGFKRKPADFKHLFVRFSRRRI